MARPYRDNYSMQIPFQFHSSHDKENSPPKKRFRPDKDWIGESPDHPAVCNILHSTPLDKTNSRNSRSSTSSSVFLTPQSPSNTANKLSSSSSSSSRMSFNSASPSLPVNVIRRNERERNRVKLLNLGFDQLRDVIPQEEGERLSKISTLKKAIWYIQYLDNILSDDSTTESRSGFDSSASPEYFPDSTYSLNTPDSSSSRKLKDKN